MSEQISKNETLKWLEHMVKGMDIAGMTGASTAYTKTCEKISSGELDALPSHNGLLDLAVKALEQAKIDCHDFAANWDCDSDAHKYNTPCRKCESIIRREAITAVLDEINQKTKEDDQ
jgi:hypothetical protein